MYIYRRAKKYDLALTCIAIAWEESFFNVYGVIDDTKDYGLMGINLYWYIRDNNLGSYKNRYLRSKVATKLTRDDNYNLLYAITKLEKLKNRYHHDWKKIWGCYNGGSKPNYRYAMRILNKVYVLRRWLRENPLP